MTIRTNFLKCFAVRAVGNALQPQISVTHQCGQQLNLSQVSNKAVGSVDKEKSVNQVFQSGISLRSIDYVPK